MVRQTWNVYYACQHWFKILIWNPLCFFNFWKKNSNKHCNFQDWYILNKWLNVLCNFNITWNRCIGKNKNKKTKPLFYLPLPLLYVPKQQTTQGLGEGRFASYSLDNTWKLESSNLCDVQAFWSQVTLCSIVKLLNREGSISYRVYTI